MPTRSFELRELFHLTLLRHLGTRLSGRSYAVKGGICLRFFHHSPRLSEDMDLDVISQVRVDTLRNAVDSVLEGRALIAALQPAGITRIETTKPKQTETTQRWKAALHMGGGEPLPTKVEFSRRRAKIAYSTGVPDPELLSRYRMPPFAAQFYDASSMAAQKITALAAPARSALRDLFDLHHLFFSAGAKSGEVSRLVDDRTVEAAAGKVARFSFHDFKEQVLPYLSGALIDLYRDPKTFEKEKADIEQTLAGILK